ncbi:MAG: hypothetical protein AAGG75_28510 [Bacteroidota bacterium]
MLGFWRLWRFRWTGSAFGAWVNACLPAGRVDGGRWTVDGERLPAGRQVVRRKGVRSRVPPRFITFIVNRPPSTKMPKASNRTRLRRRRLSAHRSPLPPQAPRRNISQS